jgi:hypothetical protein
MDMKDVDPAITKPIMGMPRKTSLEAKMPAATRAGSVLKNLIIGPGIKYSTINARELNIVEAIAAIFKAFRASLLSEARVQPEGWNPPLSRTLTPNGSA